MDPFDLFPVVPPELPGGRSARSPAEQAASGVALGVLPILNFVLVLFAGLAAHTTLILVVMPVVSAILAYFLSRRFSAPLGHSILVGFGCAAGCLVGNGCALLLAALASFYSNF
jgi:hypothetical protein